MSGEVISHGMQTKPCINLFADESKIEFMPIVQINLERYDELIKKEARLELMENAIRTTPFISDIKKLFSLEGAAE